MTCNLQFTEHINCIVGKAHSLPYLILFVNVLSRNPLLLIRAFNTYVRPLPENASPVWSPEYYLIDKIESVQRRFTKRLSGYISLDYPTRLISLEQCSLEKRCIVHDLVLMYKFGFKLADVHTSIFLYYKMMLFLPEANHTRSY